jgi:hypothetical protein
MLQAYFATLLGLSLHSLSLGFPYCFTACISFAVLSGFPILIPLRPRINPILWLIKGSKNSKSLKSGSKTATKICQMLKVILT